MIRSFNLIRNNAVSLSTAFVTKSYSSTPSRSAKIGFIGLGHMGSKMVKNLHDDGNELLIYDRSNTAVDFVVSQNNRAKSSTIQGIGKECDIIFTMLPNDAVVQDVSKELLAGRGANKTKATHISCSTISPELAKKMTDLHDEANVDFISSPVFARPDGISRREAIFMLSGKPSGKAIAEQYLKLLGRVEDFGESTGAANVVKLCGNFLIAASIEAIGESMALAEKNGVDRHKVMALLSSTIFDCLIYKGYGQRVSRRDHQPGGFSLELGYKDVSLVNKAARDVDVPMPFLSTLIDRYTAAKAKGRAGYDWSAIGLNISEDAGIDISKDLEKNDKALKESK